MERLGMEEGEPIEHKLVTRAIATAQKRVENHNFEIRKHLLEYDDVMNKQREIIYGMRRQILDGESQADNVAEWIEDLVIGTLDAHAAEGAHPEDWDLGGLTEALHRQFDIKMPAAQYEEVASRESLASLVGDAVKERYAQRERELGDEIMRALERHEMLIVSDTPMELPNITAWADAQESRGPLPGELRPDGRTPPMPGSPPAPPPRPAPAPRTPTGEKIGRNDPCYCGSGKKYKKCHLLQDQ